MTLEEALKAVVDAVDGLEAAVAAPAPAPEKDAVRAAAEGVLTSEGWTAPTAPEAETPAEAPADAPTEG